MKNGRGKLFAALSALSLLLAVGVAVLWVKSMRGEAHLTTFLKSGQRYTLKSKSGQFLLMGPPITPGDQRTAELMTLANNDDLDWHAGQSGYAWGVVRKFSPTWTMWQANWDLWEGVPAQEAGPRYSMRNVPLWLEAMEDEKRFVPADLMLTFAAGEKRNEYFRYDRNWGVNETNPSRGDWERHDLQAGRGPGWAPPMLMLKADASG